MAHVVLDMNDQRPVWARPEWFARELRSALPDDWSLAVLDTPTEGTGDGTARAHPAVLESVRDARIYMGFGIAPEVLVEGPGIEWVHTGSAGIGSSLTPTLRARAPHFTNSAGIHAAPMAEAIIGMVLHFARGFDFAVRAQRRGVWDTAPFYAADTPVREVSDMTIGILGLGGIGREAARRFVALGSRVLGLKRRPGSAPAGVEALWGDDGWDRLLRQSDALVVTAPDTPETRGMVDGDAFARMKRGAILVNVARGRIVDETALVAALRSGRLRGAALDVFAEEPLGPASPLWTMDGVLITPHVSPVSRGFWRREADLVLHNLRCFLEGRPQAMRNRVDLDAGY
ncbi:MAG: D-2-hydroxyacid dehydrogenase [Gemmatimonadetes bacterium]|nr:D-2-hydroxyacid dehydrogenase [Gemmatimonadota bacterium]